MQIEYGADKVIPDGAEACVVLCAAGLGIVKPKAIGDGWGDVHAGNVVFDVGGYEVVIFNDCGEFDYIDHIKSPDGRMVFEYSIEKAPGWFLDYDIHAKTWYEIEGAFLRTCRFYDGA